VQLPFEHSYGALPAHFFARVQPTPVRAPELVAVNEPLARLLGLDPAALASPAGVAVLAGNDVPDGASPIALAYAGHQFGGFVPRLGDGRAILLGEIVGVDGLRRDVQLKGAGPTPFSRGGDGRAALGPVLREYVLSEAMFALGVPTTRSLAAVRTGELVRRETPLPGAVLTRVAASHLRVGTFQYFAAREDREALTKLTAYALARHYPAATGDAGPALALLDAVMTAQATLVARWLALGFVHGVMNTDNTSIAGETIDYGPCAFLDAFDPSRTFSSIDRGGRYAFANQPRIAHWNVARLAEALLPLIDDDPEKAVERATAAIDDFPRRFERAHAAELRKKLGLFTAADGDVELARDLLVVMAKNHADYTNSFRALAGDADRFAELVGDGAAAWHARWRERVAREPASAEERSAAIRAANPAFIPRNHRIEEMIAAATQGDLAPFHRLNRVFARPYDDQPAEAELTTPPGEEQWDYVTFCGT
jgi:uncharacterized protein YdiU (UPF0061 family)